MLNENMIFHGYKDYKDLVYSDEYLELQRKYDSHFISVLDGCNCILKGNIVQIMHQGFEEYVRFKILFDNKEDSFGQRYAFAFLPLKEYISSKILTNVSIQAEVVIDARSSKNSITSYPNVIIQNIISISDKLMFPHYMCPRCGHDYGTGKNLADTPEYQYCELCADYEHGVEDLIQIYSREEYQSKIKNKGR